MKNLYSLYSLYFISLISGLLILTSCEQVDKKALTLNPLFRDHMVLQQQTDVMVWGENTPGQQVTVMTSWEAQSASVTDEQGKWSLSLTTPSAGGPYEISISNSDSTITIQDVMIGEVWIASGQSNMEMPLTGFLPSEPIDNYQQEIAQANHPDIRMFTVKRNLSVSKLDTMTGEWRVCSPETAADFSATGYFFARRLNQDLEVPIGIIHTSWGGTEAEAWTSKEGLNEFPDFIKEIDSYNESKLTAWVEQFELKPHPNSLEELEDFDMNDDEIINPDYDDTGWLKVKLPHEGCQTNDFIPEADFSEYLNGVFWYRRTFNIESTDSDYQLVIGSIDDADVTYVNGQKVGATLGWMEKRTYKVPASLLKKGINTVVIKHYDSGGGSAIVGPVFLENEAGNSISLEGLWSGLFYGDLKNQDIVIYGLEHQEKLKDRPQAIHIGPNQLASSLFNAMINPLIPYTIKGAIWYQGESNVGRAPQYEKLFPAMIDDWRTNWGYDFPFYFVQIAPFSYGNELSPELRDAQRKSLVTPQTGMAITMDIGDSLSIHPGNKQDVGNRLALLALDHDYNHELVSYGPMYKELRAYENYIEIHFDSDGSGLIAKDLLEGFEVAGADGVFFSAQATIIENVARLSSKEVLKPQYARYGWKDYLVPTLFNEEGLPASSFTTQ